MGIFKSKPTVESLIKTVEKTYGKADAWAYFNLGNARINDIPSCPECNNTSWGGAKKGILRVFIHPEYREKLDGHYAVDFCGNCGHIW
ncbi:MAG: hypothetical protein FWC91_09810 [Defluviitaleaceae bacterium]|nr:hypothetical protein [Defluviitaleaceae bacterium]